LEARHQAHARVEDRIRRAKMPGSNSSPLAIAEPERLPHTPPPD